MLRKSDKHYNKIDREFMQEFRSDCTVCKRHAFILTQEDDCPEYYTDIALRCTGCNVGFHYFELPVN